MGTDDIDALTLAARDRRAAGCVVRVPLATWALAAGFLLVAVPLALLTHSAREVSLPLVAFLVVAYAAASLVEFEVGAGSAVPTQVLLVPMLFLLPTGWVPLAAAGAFVLGDYAGNLIHRRACANPLVLIGSSWYAIGPVVVLLAAGEASFAWSRWPIYLVAFLAQFASDATSTAIADRRAFRTRASVSVRVIVSVYMVDALLTPLGLGIAALAQDSHAAVALALCVPALLLLFARDRRARIESLVELRDAYHGTAVVLGDVIESDDGYTGEHSRDVQALCLAVADRLGLDPLQRREVEFTALLHDVGKLRIPKHIITKPGALSDEERAVIETHTIEGEQLLAGAGGFLSHVGVLVRSCHERHDGRGYPDGLRGDQIPLAARIVACCDAYHAMTSDRSYRPAMPAAIAVAELKACAGSQFDPAVVEALLLTLEADVPSTLSLGSHARVKSVIGHAAATPAGNIRGCARKRRLDEVRAFEQAPGAGCV